MTQLGEGQLGTGKLDWTLSWVWSTNHCPVLPLLTGVIFGSWGLWKYAGGVRVCFNPPPQNVTFFHSKPLLE